MIQDPRQICAQCRRGPQVAYNRPHSLHGTKRLVKINLQPFRGRRVCNDCRRTLTKRGLTN